MRVSANVARIYCDLDDKMLWEILCHASVEQGYIESSCRALPLRLAILFIQAKYAVNHHCDSERSEEAIFETPVYLEECAQNDGVIGAPWFGAALVVLFASTDFGDK